MTAAKPKSLTALAGIALSFTVLCTIVIALGIFGVVSFQLALLMLVGLVALYFGVGVLILLYRFVARLE